MTWYLGITTTKKIPPFPGAEKERGELAVVRQLTALGIEAHAPVRIDFVRKGKRRYAEPETEMLLPNYVFADIADHQFFDAVQARGLSPSLMAISRGDIHGVLRFIRDAEEKKAEAEAIIAELDRARAIEEAKERRAAEAKARAAMCQFEPGEALMVLSGPFKEQVVRFTRMVNQAHERHPMVGFEREMFGATVSGMIDPLDVRKAG